MSDGVVELAVVAKGNGDDSTIHAMRAAAVEDHVQVLHSAQTNGSDASGDAEKADMLDYTTDVFDLDRIVTTASSSSAARGAAERAGPPSLNYDLRARKGSLLWNVGLMVLANVCCPIFVFYIAWHFDTTHLSGNNNLLYGVTTITLGTLQIPQFILRWITLYKRNGARDTGVLVAPPPVPCEAEPELLQASPTAASTATGKPSRRNALRRSFVCWDQFQFCFFWGIVVGSTVLVLGTSLNGDVGYFLLLALFPAIVFAYIGLLMFLAGIAHARGLRIPFDYFDLVKGDLIRPGIAYAWVDLTALDGGGGPAFRHSFTARYEASPPFRAMLVRLNWIVSTLLIAQIFPAIILVVLVNDRPAVYGPTFAILLAFLLAAVGFSLLCAKRGFARERAYWRRPQEHHDSCES